MKKLITLFAIGSLLLTACAQNDLASNIEADADKNKAGEMADFTAQTGEMCGGIAGVTCDNPEEFCLTEIEAQCGAADQTGTCQPKPQMCTQQYDPVCGCDGQTYGNECSAHSKGISAAYKGECTN